MSYKRKIEGYDCEIVYKPCKSNQNVSAFESFDNFHLFSSPETFKQFELPIDHVIFPSFRDYDFILFWCHVNKEKIDFSFNYAEYSGIIKIRNVGIAANYVWMEIKIIFSLVVGFSGCNNIFDFHIFQLRASIPIFIFTFVVFYRLIL